MKWIKAFFKFVLWLLFQAILLVGLGLFGGWLISLVDQMMHWRPISIIILLGIVVIFIKLSKKLDEYL